MTFWVFRWVIADITSTTHVYRYSGGGMTVIADVRASGEFRSVRDARITLDRPIV